MQHDEILKTECTTNIHTNEMHFDTRNQLVRKRLQEFRGRLSRNFQKLSEISLTEWLSIVEEVDKNKDAAGK